MCGLSAVDCFSHSDLGPCRRNTRISVCGPNVNDPDGDIRRLSRSTASSRIHQDPTMRMQMRNKNGSLADSFRDRTLLSAASSVAQNCFLKHSLNSASSTAMTSGWSLPKYSENSLVFAIAVCRSITWRRLLVNSAKFSRHFCKGILSYLLPPVPESSGQHLRLERSRRIPGL